MTLGDRVRDRREDVADGRHRHEHDEVLPAPKRLTHEEQEDQVDPRHHPTAGEGEHDGVTITRRDVLVQLGLAQKEEQVPQTDRPDESVEDDDPCVARHRHHGDDGDGPNQRVADEEQHCSDREPSEHREHGVDSSFVREIPSACVDGHGDRSFANCYVAYGQTDDRCPLKNGII